MPLAVAVLLGVMPLAAQGTGADTAAKNAQGCAPNTGASVGSLASTDPWVRGGAIALPGRSAAEVDQAVRAADQELAGALSTALIASGDPFSTAFAAVLRAAAP